jgi:hypothetical protein
VANHARILADEDHDDQNPSDDEFESKNAEPKQKKAKPSPQPQHLAALCGGGASPQSPQSGAGAPLKAGDAKVQHEKAKANVDRIIKLRTELEMEYVKALYIAFDMEKKLEEVSTTTIGSTLSAAPL